MGTQGSDREPAGPAGAAAHRLISQRNRTCLWLVTPEFYSESNEVNKNVFLPIRSSANPKNPRTCRKSTTPDVFSGPFQAQELPPPWCSEIQAGSKGEVGVHTPHWPGSK